MAKATKATSKAKETKKPATKATKATPKVETQVGQTFSTDSLARAISAKSVDGDGKAKYSITEATEFINLFKDSVADALRTGQKIQLTGFLTIAPSYRNEREGNNVLTGDKMTIPASVTFNAKVGKGLKDIAKELPDEIVEAIKNSK